MTPPSDAAKLSTQKKKEAAREVIDVLEEMALLLVNLPPSDLQLQ